MNMIIKNNLVTSQCAVLPLERAANVPMSSRSDRLSAAASRSDVYAASSGSRGRYGRA